MRVYTYGQTGCVLSSGSVSKEQLDKLKKEYIKLVASTDEAYSLSVTEQVPPLFNHHSGLELRRTSKMGVIGVDSHDGFISVFDPAHEEWSDCFIDSSLRMIDFTGYGFETISGFLEENVCEEDYEIWREFLEEKNTNLEAD